MNTPTVSMMLTVSVVVPIYNVHEYLETCLGSLPLCNPEIEVILVNDGATDGSKEICQRYAERYNTVRVVNKSNGGLSDARNAGIMVATGQWIYFLDGDDWLAPNAIEMLRSYAQENDCDIVQGNFFYAFPNHNDVELSTSNPNMILTKHEAMEQLVCNRFIKNFAWGKLYRADFVKNHLFEVGKFFEDVYWQYKMIDQCSRYGVVTVPLYYYRQREQSISGTFSEKGLDLLIGQVQRMAFIKEHYPDLMSFAFRTLWRTALTYKQFAYNSSVGVQKVYKNFWQNEIVATYGSDKTDGWSKSESIAYTLSIKYPMLYPLYNIAQRIINRIF
jgi:glycosyltransferase involved in cell wall biosynthesis